MQIILLRDVENLGLEGEIKRVKDGYARNFLIPSKAAVEASANNIKNLSLRLKNLEVSRKKRVATASEKKKMLEDFIITIKSKTGEKGRLFGSITTAQIAEKLAELGFSEVDKKHIRVPHIKEIGNYFASIKLLESVNASLKVKVESENPLIDYTPEKKSSRRKREVEMETKEANTDKTAKQNKLEKEVKENDKEVSKETVHKEVKKSSKEADSKHEILASEKKEKKEIRKDKKQEHDDGKEEKHAKNPKKVDNKEKESVKPAKKAEDSKEKKIAKKTVSEKPKKSSKKADSE